MRNYKLFFVFEILCYPNFKTNSFCFGGRNHSSILSVEVYLTEQVKNCNKNCDEKNSKFVCNNTTAGEGLGNYCKNLHISSAKACKKLASTVRKIFVVH